MLITGKAILIVMFTFFVGAMSGCLHVPDPNNPGQTKIEPDYELIELGSYAAYTALLSHKKMPGTSAQRALQTINEIETYLVPLSGEGQPLTFGALRLIVRKKVPSEYAPLSELGLVLIQRALSNYKTPIKDPIARSQILVKVSRSVLNGAKMAIQPYVANQEIAWEPGQSDAFTVTGIIHP